MPRPNQIRNSSASHLVPTELKLELFYTPLFSNFHFPIRKLNAIVDRLAYTIRISFNMIPVKL